MEDPWWEAFDKARHARRGGLYSAVARRRWELAVERLLGASAGRCRVLKTDAWNEAANLGITETIRLRHDVVLLDVSPGIAKAATSQGHSVVVGSIESLPFADESFDATLDVSTSDHLPEVKLAQITSEYARVLKPRGRLLLIHNSSRSIVWRILRNFGISSPAYDGVPPVYYFAPSLVEDVLEEHFLIEAKKCTSVLGWAKPLINRINPRCIWLVDLFAETELRLPWWVLTCTGRQMIFFCRKK